MERSQKDIAIRLLTAREEFAEAVELQRTIWGFAELDLLPVRLFIVASKVGGHAFGAFDDTRPDQNKMVAFCLAIPGLKPGGKFYLHSHMLGVIEQYRNYGLGRRLKLAQRDDALERGVDLIEWTFDPLELKNAFFNIERLGAVVRRFVFNQYGVTPSVFQGSLPTDRCIAEWQIASPRVAGLLSGSPVERPLPVEKIEVPNAIGDWKRADPARARETQALVSSLFDKYLSQGLAVTGFERGETSSSYLLSPWPSN